MRGIQIMIEEKLAIIASLDNTDIIIHGRISGTNNIMEYQVPKDFTNDINEAINGILKPVASSWEHVIYKGRDQWYNKYCQWFITLGVSGIYAKLRLKHRTNNT